MARENRKAKKILFLSALKIPYILFYRYSSDTRRKFTREHPHLSKLYNYLLKLIGRKLNLPVKACETCGISYLPDYRTKDRQKHCPYGCVELNRRRNKQNAKSRYRKKIEAKSLASKYNLSYRKRKQNGWVSDMPEINERKKEEIERKLTAQIRFFYKKLNPEVGTEKLKQLDKVLKNLSHRISST